MNKLKPCPVCGSSNVFTTCESPFSLKRDCVACLHCGSSFANRDIVATGGDIVVWWNNEVPRRGKCKVEVGDNGDTCTNCGKEYDLRLLGSFGSYDGVQADFCPFCGAEVEGVVG